MGRYQGTVVSIGRKWIQCKVAGSKKTYMADVLINEVSRDWAVGETYRFEAQYDETSPRVKLHPHPPDTSEEHRLAEGERWMSYVRTAAEKHYIYQRGLNEIRALGLDEIYRAEIESMQDSVMDATAAAYVRDMRFKAEQGYSLDALIAKLTKTGRAAQYKSEVQEIVALRDAVREDKKKAAAQRRKKAAAELQERLVEIVWDHDKGKVRRGMLIYHQGRAYRVDTCVYRESGGISRGASAEEWFSVRAEDVTMTRAGQDLLDREDPVRIRRLAVSRTRSALRDALEHLRQQMEWNGRGVERIDDQPVPLPDGERVLDAKIDYEHGLLVLIEKRDHGDDLVWHIITRNASDKGFFPCTIRTDGEEAISIELSQVEGAIEALRERRREHIDALMEAGENADVIVIY